MRRNFYWLFILVFLGSEKPAAEEIKVAVASNFATAIKPIAAHFEANTGHRINLIFGATGKLYAQIKNGAPYAVFLAADKHRPALLEQEGIAQPNSRFTYAVGKLVLWSPKPDYVDRQGNVLETGDYRHLAIANPALAPYGQAARHILQSRGLWQQLATRLVRGGNINQTFQFVRSGNAELGFVAYAQIKRQGQPIEGSVWEIPQTLYPPIEQQAVLLKEQQAARDLLAFLRSSPALEIIREHGYDA